MPSPRASADGTIRRRELLVGALGLAVVAVAASACGSPVPPKVDDLVAQRDLAIADRDLASAAATAAVPAMARALTEIATERGAHAAALSTEIARAAGQAEPSSTQPSTPTTTTGAPLPPPSVGDVVAALRRSADSATQLVPTLAGYRAGLLGSIAASCTASYSVALGAPRKAI